MNKAKFSKYKKLKAKSVRDSLDNNNHAVRSPWFEEFWNDEPTREQFNEIVYGLTICPDHFWILSGRK